MTNSLEMANDLITNAGAVFQSAAAISISIIGFIVLVSVARRILSKR